MSEEQEREMAMAADRSEPLGMIECEECRHNAYCNIPDCDRAQCVGHKDEAFRKDPQDECCIFSRTWRVIQDKQQKLA